MTAYEITNILMSLGNRLDIQWGMFITVHMALLGGIIYVDRPLRGLEKMGTIFVYSGFAIINYLVMENQLVLIDYAFQDVITLSKDICCQSNNIIQGLAEGGNQDRSELGHKVLWLSHVLMFLLVIVSIIFDQALTPESSETESENDTL